VIEEAVIQDRLHSTTVSITPPKILSQARYRNPTLSTRALHCILFQFSAYKEPQKQSCQA